MALHPAAAVGTAAVGLFWVGNLINGAPPVRHRHRLIVKWTIHCPVCGPELYAERAGGDGCDHAVSFLDDIPVVEVVPQLGDLLDIGSIRLGG